MKKSQGLSINVIIIVAIALIVLVVLIAIFTGRMGAFVGSVDQSTTCTNACSAVGMTKSDTAADLDGKDTCLGKDRSRWIDGDFRDLTETQGCCCLPKT